MADELEQQGQAAETETTEQVTGSNQQKQTAFTQEEVNKIVAKEKAAWKRSQDKLTGDHETLVDGLRKDLTARDEIIAKQLSILEKDLGLDEETQELLEGLDTVARYAWVLKKLEKSEKKEIPRTPRAEGEPVQNPFKRTQTV